jgi:hypothetical protein
MNHSSSALTAEVGALGPINLSDEVWGVEHIALYLKQDKRSLYPVINAEGFPLPLTNQKRNRRWLASAVRAYFVERQRGAVHPKLQSVPNTSYEPISIHTKKRNVAI